MSLTVYLGSQLVPTPGDVDGYQHRIVRDFDRRMIYSEAPGTVTFGGGAYKILRDAFLADFCASIQIRVYDTCNGLRVLPIAGEIILADITWNLARCRAEVPIQMGSVGARILDNMDLVLTPNATQSKNEQSITACPTFTLKVFDPQTPATTTNRTVYDWKEALQHAVSFLTDGTTIVNNDWYDALPDDERIALCQGVYWRTGSQPLDPASWSLQSLWMEIARRFNLWMVVQQDPVGNTSIRIVSDADSFATSAALSIEKVDEIEQTIDEDALFGSVVVGENREKNRTGSSFSALPYYLSLSHTEESYGVRCLCNRGDELDLRGDWVADHGTLEHVMWRDTTDTGIDEDVVIIQYTDSLNEATAIEYATPGVPLYNESMLNYRVINRYSSLCDVIMPQEPTAGVLARNDAVLAFNEAYLTGLTVTWVPEGSNIVASLDNSPLPPSPLATGIYDTWPIDTPPNGSDPDNAWTLSSRYTASSTGMRTVGWSFISSVRVDSGGSNLDDRRYWRLRAFVRHFTSADVLLTTYQRVSTIVASGTFLDYVDNVVLFMGATDYLTITMVPEIVLPDDFQTVNDLTFKLSASPGRTVTVVTTELAIASGNPGTRRVALLDFERHISTAMWVALLADPRTPITVDGAGLPVTLTWPKELSRDILRGKTTITLMHALQ